MRLSATHLSFLVGCLFSVFSVSCGVLNSLENVEKSTTEVGDKMDETNHGIEKTNDKMDETNGKMDETNSGIKTTNDKMDDMKDSMAAMNDKLIETNQRMDNMNNALNRMYQDLRQGDSLAARLQTIEKMSETPTLKGKSVYAAQYFMSFEYQLWKGEGPDVQALRDILKRDAVDEFVQTLRRFAKSSLPINAMSSDRDLLSMEALALLSHMQNSNSVLTMNNKNLPLESMHSLLKESLEYGHKLALGTTSMKDVPEFAVFALREPELVKYLFELRVNMLPALLVGELSKVADDGFVRRWLSRASVWLHPWTADLTQKNAIELKEYISWLKWADADLSFLNSINVTPRIDSSLFKVLRQARFVDRSTAPSGSEDGFRAAAKTEFKESLQRFMSHLP